MKRLLIVLILVGLLIIPINATTGERGQYFMGYQSAPYNYSITIDLVNDACEAIGEKDYPYGTIGDYSWYATQLNDTITASHSGTPGYWDRTTAWPDETAWLNYRSACNSSSPHYESLLYWAVNGTFFNLTADFAGTPRNGTGPLEVTLQDASLNVSGSATYTWSISPSAGVYWWDADQEGETQVITILQNGAYTVSLNVTDSLLRTDTETKTDYINVYNSTSIGTVRIRPLDAISGYPIQGANISVWDQSNSSWTNQTATSGEVSVNIINGNLFDAYGSAYGYDDNDFTGETAVNGQLYVLPMYPATMPANVSAGNVTLYVTVVEADDSTKRISGALVSVAAPWPKVITGTTNSNGLAQFTVPNQTALMIAVSKSGYMGASLSVNSGTGNGGDAYIEQTVLLEKLVKTTAPTQTTLPGGGTPTATVTVIPGCEDPTSPECHTAQNSATMGWLSENSMSLVMFFVVCFIIFMIKGIGR